MVGPRPRAVRTCRPRRRPRRRLRRRSRPWGGMACRGLRASRRARARDWEAARDRARAGCVLIAVRGGSRTACSKPTPPPADCSSRSATAPCASSASCASSSTRRRRLLAWPDGLQVVAFDPERDARGVSRGAAGGVRGSLGVQPTRLRVVVEEPPAERAIRPGALVRRPSRGRDCRRHDLHRATPTAVASSRSSSRVARGASRASARRSSRTRSAGSGSAESAASGSASMRRATPGRFAFTSVPE